MHGGLHRCRRQAATDHPPRLASLDQVCTRQHVEVLHDGRQGDRETPGNLGHRQLGLAREAIDDGAPRRVGERREGKIELGATKLNHVVKYCAMCPEVKWAHFTMLCATLSLSDDLIAL
jgi:hypothetical protein